VSVLPAKVYRYRGKPGWTPESAADDIPPPPPVSERFQALRDQRSAEARARMTAFCAHRDEGMGIPEASRLAGVHVSTGRRYEALRRGTGRAA
jgi:hypothetical protein